MQNKTEINPSIKEILPTRSSRQFNLEGKSQERGATKTISWEEDNKKSRTQLARWNQSLTKTIHCTWNSRWRVYRRHVEGNF